MSASSPSSTLSPSSASKIPGLSLPATCEPPGEKKPAKQAVWVIFGATGHMGHSLLKSCISHNDKVTAVGWTHEHPPEQIKRLEEPNVIALLCDVRVRETVDAVLKKTIAHWGRIDLIANCTGYGVIGACEDQDEWEMRNQFETNFMGTLNIIQLSLPYFREQQHGRYLIFSSTSGALGVPGLGLFCATKYAVEGLIESMLYEVDVFNIKATLVEPAHMRLDEPDSKAHDLKLFAAFKVQKPTSPYSNPHAPAGHARRIVQWMNDQQPTSTVKSAELVWQLGHCSYPPLRLLLGSYAVESIRDRLRSIIEEIEDWKHLNFPAAQEQEEGLADEQMRDVGDDGE